MKDDSLTMWAVVVSPMTKVHSAAEPHMADLRHILPEQARDLAKELGTFSAGMRAKYAGKQFAEVRQEFADDVKQAGFGVSRILARICGARLKP